MFGKNKASESKNERIEMSTENVLNTISRGTVVIGNISTRGDIRIEGKIIGTVICSSKLVIGEHGFVEGNIDAKNANIAGEVKGEVVIRELLQLQETGKINGDIFTSKLAVQIGASFSGSCRMGEDAKSVLSKAPEKIEDQIVRESGSGKIRNIMSPGTNGNSSIKVEEKSAG